MDWYTGKIIDSIVHRFRYGIKEVRDIQEISMIDYTKENIDKLSDILKKGNYDQIQSLKPPKDLLGEDITIIRFRDQDEKSYYAFYYDSIELNQSPVVLEVFPNV